MANVTIYSTPYCVYCKMAKIFFAEKNIKFQDKDVASDTQAREEMMKKSGQMGVPVIDIDGKIIIGFDKSKLQELLGTS
ncbi:MAG: glutaredoxin domain-containing protein [Patescibacteria group bacterium]